MSLGSLTRSAKARPPWGTEYTGKLSKVLVPVNLLGLGGYAAGGCSPRSFNVSGFTTTNKQTNKLTSNEPHVRHKRILGIISYDSERFSLSKAALP